MRKEDRHTTYIVISTYRGEECRKRGISSSHVLVHHAVVVLLLLLLYGLWQRHHMLLVLLLKLVLLLLLLLLLKELMLLQLHIDSLLVRLSLLRMSQQRLLVVTPYSLRWDCHAGLLG